MNKVRLKLLLLVKIVFLFIYLVFPATGDEGTYKETILGKSQIKRAPSINHEVGEQRGSIKLMLDFADHLFLEEEYFRAIGVYKYILFISSNEEYKRHARWKIGLAYQMGQQYEAAIAHYNELLSEGISDEEETAIKINRAVCIGEKGDVIDSIHLLEQYNKKEIPSFMSLYADFYLALMNIKLHNKKDALFWIKNGLSKCQDQYNSTCEALFAMDSRLKYPEPERKSPLFGGILSTLLPGAGAVYAKHYIDGLYYFTFISLDVLVSLDIYDKERSFNDQKASFYFLGGLGLLIYISNIIQGYNMTSRLNAINEVNYYRFLEAGFKPSPLFLPYNNIP